MSDTSTQYNDSAGETTKAGDPVCACAKDPTPPPPQDRPCKHATMMVKCSHKGRQVFIAPTPPMSPLVPVNSSPVMALLGATTATLEVVAGPDKNADKVECTTIIEEGPCPEHKDKVFDLHPQEVPGTSDKTLKENKSAKLVFDARSLPIYDPLTVIWPVRPPTQLFQIDAHTHDGIPVTGYVRAYPDIKWSAGFSLKIETVEKKKKEEGWFSSSTKIAHIQEFKPEGFIKASWNGDADKFEVSFGKSDKWTQIFEVVTTAAEVGKFVKKELAGALGIDVTIRFPSFEVKGDWGWQELAGSPKCDFGFMGLSIGFQPLIGATVSASILEFLLKKWPGVGTMLAELKEEAAEGWGGDGPASAKFDADITLSLSGDVNAFGKFEKPPGGSASGAGVMEGIVKAKVEGKVEAEGELFVVKAAAKASLSAEAGLKGTGELGVDEVGIYGEGKLSFTGLIVKAIVEAGLDVKTSTKTPDPKLNEFASAGTTEAVENSNPSGKGSYKHDFVNEEFVIVDACDFWVGERKYFFS